MSTADHEVEAARYVLEQDIFFPCPTSYQILQKRSAAQVSSLGLVSSTRIQLV